MSPKTIDHIIKHLRLASVTWEGRSLCLKRHRKKVFDRLNKKTGEKIFKFHWQCGKCLEWYRDVKMLEVDHIDEVGPFKGDLNAFCKRLFCSQKNLMALCIPCHLRKTAAFSSARTRWKRKGDFRSP